MSIVPDQLYGEEVKVNVADTTSIGSMDWRELFKDPQPQALMNAGLADESSVSQMMATYLEVLTAKQTLLSAQLSQVANRFKEIQSVINLYQALGGGANAGQAS